MAQTKSGAIKLCANKCGISISEYVGLISKGYKYCYKCKLWKEKSCFSSDSSRHDNLSPVCSICRSNFSKSRYKKKPKKHSGPFPNPPRDGDKKQARRRINVLVRTGKIPHPNSIPCYDCGHVYKPGERRHEYDHYKGYSKDNHYDVQPVCTLCHRKRSRTIQLRDNSGRYKHKE